MSRSRLALLATALITILTYLAPDLFEQPNTQPDVAGTSSEQYTSNVLRVIDGDTFQLTSGEKVRLIGINTPELSGRTEQECFAQEAHDELRALIENKTVMLQKDVSETDRYGRLLRYVYVDDVFINYTLVENGYAAATAYPPDITHQEDFEAAEREARMKNRGLWKACTSISNPPALQ